MTELAASPSLPSERTNSTGRKMTFLTANAHTQLNKAAKQLKISNVEYTSAAIEYFALSGLDPTAAQTKGLVSIGAQVGDASYEIRRQAVEIGNRIVAIQRGFEREQFKFLQAQQVEMVSYLERIETNILDHQVAVESQMLAPMIERLFRNGIDSNMTRVLVEELVMKSESKPFTKEDSRESMRAFDAQRDRQLVRELRKFLETATVATPVVSTRPEPVVPPLPAAKAKLGVGTTPAQPKS